MDQPISVVSRTEFIHVPWTGSEPQEFDMDHCVQFLQIDSHFGEFELLDSSKRVIGSSVKGRCSLLKKDIYSDVGRVWYDAMGRISVEHKTLSEKYKVQDPGMDLTGLKPLYLNFTSAPKAAERINHIPVYCRVTCLWDRDKANYSKII